MEEMEEAEFCKSHVVLYFVAGDTKVSCMLYDYVNAFRP